MGVSFSACSHPELFDAIMNTSSGNGLGNRVYDLAYELHHTNWRVSMSYGGFNLYRKAVAEYCGVDLDTMRGHGGDTEWSEWPEEHAALIPFMHHSDCEGVWTKAQCAGFVEWSDRHRLECAGGHHDKPWLNDQMLAFENLFSYAAANDAGVALG